jgi:hypothetical protein
MGEETMNSRPESRLSIVDAQLKDARRLVNRARKALDKAVEYRDLGELQSLLRVVLARVDEARDSLRPEDEELLARVRASIRGAEESDLEAVICARCGVTVE